jgi:co-chaperonin GroES (HSP10)
MKPLADHVLIRKEPWTNKKKGMILLPDNSEIGKQFARGEVLAVGPGVFTHNGIQLIPPITIGDHVVYYTASAIPIMASDEEVYLVREPNIVAILDSGEFEARQSSST